MIKDNIVISNLLNCRWFCYVRYCFLRYVFMLAPDDG